VGARQITREGNRPFQEDPEMETLLRDADALGEDRLGHGERQPAAALPAIECLSPHLRIMGTTEWLGVQFTDAPEVLNPGDEPTVQMKCLLPLVDYSGLHPGRSVRNFWKVRTSWALARY
jgi:hypothetical protein